jgi:hypothetical protein
MKIRAPRVFTVRTDGKSVPWAFNFPHGVHNPDVVKVPGRAVHSKGALWRLPPTVL